MNIMDKKLLEMISHAIAGETAAARYYMKLADLLISPDDKDKIRGVMLDEVKHRRYFEDLYHAITGERPDLSKTPLPAGEGGEPRGTLPAIFEERILDELEDTEFYVQIYTALVSLEYRDVLFEIITDEERHAQLLNYLYSKYSR